MKFYTDKISEIHTLSYTIHTLYYKQSMSSSVRKNKNKVKRVMTSNNNGHVWQFSRVGGVNRVNLLSGADLLALDQLDKKLWAALSCPVDGLEIDPKTLQLIDTDKDNRIRVPEVIAAVKWITSVINDPDDLLRSNQLYLFLLLTTKPRKEKFYWLQQNRY